MTLSLPAMFDINKTAFKDFIEISLAGFIYSGDFCWNFNVE